MARRSVITWKNAEVTIEQKDDDVIVLLFAGNVCVGRAVVRFPIEPRPPDFCKPIGHATACITTPCPHWDPERGCIYYCGRSAE